MRGRRKPAATTRVPCAIREAGGWTPRRFGVTGSINVVLDATSWVIFVRLAFLVQRAWRWRPGWCILTRRWRCSRRCWRDGPRSSGPRFLKDNTIGPRVELVRRFAVFTDQYPWQWESAEAEAFITSSPVAVSAARNYQNTLRLCGTGGRPGAWNSPVRCRGRSWMSGTRSRM